jgi:hypothetical protein
MSGDALTPNLETAFFAAVGLEGAIEPGKSH